MNNQEEKEKLIVEIIKLRQEYDSLKKLLDGNTSDNSQTENAFWGSEENYRNLIELMPDGIYRSTHEGKFIYVNPAMVKLLGYDSKDELMSIDIKKQLYFEASDRDSVVLYESNKELGIYRMKKKDGSELWVEDHGWLRHDKATNILFHEGILRDITERRLAEKKLNEINRRFSDLVESTNGIVWEADASTLLFNYVSKNAERMLGYPTEDWHGEGFWISKIHPEDRQQATQFCMNQTKQCKDHEFEYRFVAKNGEIVWLRDFVKVVLENGKPKWLRGLMIDITRSKIAEENLRILSQAVEQSPVSIIITDTSGIIQYVNPKFVETSGYNPEEIIGQSPKILKSGHTSQKEYKKLWQTISGGGEWRGEFYNRRKNGTFYWESANISPIIDAKGAITHFISINEEITYRKELDFLLKQKIHEIGIQNEEYKRLNEELITAKDRAEESDRLKSAFLANMSHEIRTPMNGILGFAELLKIPDLSGEEQQSYIRVIEKSGIRMLNIINDIVDISKIEAGLMQVDIKDTNINEEIDHIYAFFRPQVEARQLLFWFNKGLPTEEATIKSDSEKIYSILTNLVKNAIKYTDEGSIEFGYLKKGNSLEFYVKDTGIGISADKLETVFNRFIQVGHPNKRAIQGAGLGLSISKAYAEMLGGKIWLESQVDKGSTFYFTIPYATGVEKEPASKGTPSATQEMVPAKNLKILIAEDDDISKLLISKVLYPYSEEILKACTGLEAVNTCRENPDINLVLMDINMPEMNGHEATRQIRRFNKNVIIIAQTAYGLSGDSQMAMEAGCNDYISKPIMKNELLRLIKKYFNR